MLWSHLAELVQDHLVESLSNSDLVPIMVPSPMQLTVRGTAQQLCLPLLLGCTFCCSLEMSCLGRALVVLDRGCWTADWLKGFSQVSAPNTNAKSRQRDDVKT